MTNEQSLVSADTFDRVCTQVRTRERTLNSAIVQAHVSENSEQYVEIFDRSYNDDIEVRSETGGEPIRGKSGNRLDNSPQRA
jgi:hypothetical protein